MARFQADTTQVEARKCCAAKRPGDVPPPPPGLPPDVEASRDAHTEADPHDFCFVQRESDEKCVDWRCILPICIIYDMYIYIYV